MKISWVVLTYNRADKVKRAMDWNREHSGRVWDELIWVDNGSSPDMSDIMAPHADVIVLNARNLGVAKGYNRGFAMATGDLICVTGCDMLMPKNWLSDWAGCFNTISELAVACIYSKPISDVPERLRGPIHEVGGRLVQPAMPMDRRIFRRELLQKAGYLREDFGLYGHEDCEWAFRAERVCREEGWYSCVLPDRIATHLGTEGCDPYDGHDDQAYHEFKRRESTDPAKQAKLEWCRENGYPYYNPYA